MSTAVAAPATVAVRRIRVWLGKQLVIDHLEPDEEKAAKYADAMQRRYASLRVTNDPHDAAPPTAQNNLPPSP